MKSTATTAASAARIIPRPEHNISRSNIASSALKVLYRLREGGYQAFLVGGAVRDLLLGLRPKDFDIATDAHPDEVHALFRNARLIGRRFRLAHVRFGREIIEVATFRASGGDEDDDASLDHEGRILRDNVYGTIDEDVWRRDFTANSLYYNIADFSVWDFTGGVEDIRDRRLRLIGDPDRRLREDPVRMLRAIRFAAKLGFTLDTTIVSAIAHHAPLLANVPPARLFDEFLKLFQGGHGEQTYRLLREHGLFRILFPDTAEALERDSSGNYEAFVLAALRNTDARVAEEKSVTPMFLLGVFMWQPARERATQMLSERKMSESQALGVAAYELTLRQQSRIAVPKRFSMPMREMLAMQPRFERINGRRAMGLLEHNRFRAAYDFYALRAQTGDADTATAGFWTEVQDVSGADLEQRFGIDVDRAPRTKKRRRRRRSKTRKTAE